MKVKFIHSPNGITGFLVNYLMALFERDGYPVAMKIDTWLELVPNDRPLSNRINYLISDNPKWEGCGVIPITSIKELPSAITEIWAVGNAKLLTQFAFTATEFEIHTQKEHAWKIHACFEQFPEFDLVYESSFSQIVVLHYKHKST